MPTEKLRTSCTRDCPDACGLLATVEDGRVVRLQGDPEHPITRGFLCYRVGTHYLDRHHSAERLHRPLVRRGDGFEPIDWEAALDLAARELERVRAESGAAAVLHVQGGGSLGILKNLNKAFFRLFGGATETSGDVCDGAGSFANEQDFGTCDMNDPEDLVNARAVILWGKNVTASSPHMTPLLKAARERGAETWLIDPLPHRAAALVDRYVQTRPGGDGALALAACRMVLDRGAAHPEVLRYSENAPEFFRLVQSRSAASFAAEADVPLSIAEDLARLFLERRPVTTLVGWGLQRRGNGATQVRAIAALHALTGNLGEQGASCSFTVTRRKPFDLGFVRDLARHVPRTIETARLGPEILGAGDPPIRAVVIDNGNPVATHPESETTRRALESRDFTLVIDPFLTDTARAAHLVLPCTTMLEERDLVGSYGHHHVSASRPVAARLPGVRTDLEIYQALADRLGFGAALAGSDREWIDRLGAPLAARGLGYDALVERAHRDPGAPRVAFAGRVFPTPSGKFRFLTEHRAAPHGDPAFPLVLHGLSTGRWQGSQLTEADEEREGPLTVTVHPASAGDLADGDHGLLESAIGAIPVLVRHDSAYRRDTVYVPRARSVRLRRCVNLLVRARATDFGGGAAYYDERVRLVRAATPAR